MRRSVRQGAGGGRKPGGGVFGQHGGGAKLPELELHDRRHPQPETGTRVAIAIKARINRRVNIDIGSLRLWAVGAAFGGAVAWKIHQDGVAPAVRSCPLNVQL